MKPHTRTATALAALALAAVPAMAVANPPSTVPPENPGTAHHQGQGNHPNQPNPPQGPDYNPAEPTPGPKAPLPEKAKAYGVYCRGKSKKHQPGEKGTEFSRCVTAMAKAATHPNMPPGQACKGESKEHVKGEKGTAFSRCVRTVNELRRREHKEEKEAA